MDITNCNICHDREFEDVLKSIHYSTLNPEHQDDDEIEIAPLRIVSVVVCSEFKDTVLDLGLIYEVLKSSGDVDEEDVNFQEQREPKRKPGDNSKGKKNLFYNSLLWKIQVRDGEGDESLMNVSLKCFPNGKFQYAGFNTIHAIKLVPRIVSSKIRNIEGSMDPPTTKIEEPRIVQINSAFYILKDKKSKQLKQIVLNDLLLKYEHTSVGGRVISSTFMPEKYPGINVKFRIAQPQTNKKEEKVTLLIFSTGSVLINGHHDIYQYREAYYMLCKLVHRHREILITDNLLN